MPSKEAIALGLVQGLFGDLNKQPRGTRPGKRFYASDEAAGIFAEGRFGRSREKHRLTIHIRGGTRRDMAVEIVMIYLFGLKAQIESAGPAEDGWRIVATVDSRAY